MLMATMTPWYLYLIRTADNALYTGITTDVARRYRQHQTGKGAKALRGKGELTLAFAAQVGDRSLALRIEYRIKQLTKRQKERLVTEREAFEALLSSLQSRCLKTIEVVVILHQPRHAFQRILSQTVYLESAFRTGPTAVKIVMRGQFKTEAAI